MLSTGFKLPQKGILIGIQVRPQPSGGPLPSCSLFPFGESCPQDIMSYRAYWTGGPNLSGYRLLTVPVWHLLKFHTKRRFSCDLKLWLALKRQCLINLARLKYSLQNWWHPWHEWILILLHHWIKKWHSSVFLFHFQPVCSSKSLECGWTCFIISIPHSRRTETLTVTLTRVIFCL